nr:unnamed protein product [Callosobruchus analis]
MKILITHHRLFEQNKYIIFLWRPGHAGIRGNELADEAARQATEARITDVGISPPGRCQITKWSLPPLTRQEQVVLTRLRIGHTFLTHSHLLLRNPPESCRSCDVLLTWKHIFLECPLHMVARILFNLPLSFLKTIKLSTKCNLALYVAQMLFH